MRALCLLLTLATAGGASAQEGDQRLTQQQLDDAERLFFEGLAAYRAEKFEAAAVAFQKAYVITKERDLLFNLGRSRERLGDKAGAVEWYRAYLGTQPADETAIIHRIRQLGGDPTPPPKEKKADPVKKPVDTPPPEIVESGAGPWPWVALGVGVAAAGAGTFFGLAALDDASAARDEQIRSEAQSLKDSAESNALYADIAFGVGALAVGTAVVLWLQSDSAAASTGQVQIGPTADGAHIGYSVSF